MTFTMLMVQYLISLLVCAVFYVITFTPSFISSPKCAHLSPSTRQLLFIFWHLILRCPSSYCVPHAIIKCRRTILISFFPCLAAQVFTREDCSIRPLVPLFAYLDLKLPNPPECRLPLIRWVSSMCFHFDKENCCSVELKLES